MPFGVETSRQFKVHPELKEALAKRKAQDEETTNKTIRNSGIGTENGIQVLRDLLRRKHGGYELSGDGLETTVRQKPDETIKSLAYLSSIGPRLILPIRRK